MEESGAVVDGSVERRGRLLQRLTIAWNVAEVGVTVVLGALAGSLALVAFGLDSLVEVFASLVVLWHMTGGSSGHRDRRARFLVGLAFAALAAVLFVTGVRALVVGIDPAESVAGIVYLSATAAVMFSLAIAKRRIGARLHSEPFLAEARMTFLDGVLASSILAALVVNVAWGWWWADAVAALVIGVIAAAESVELIRSARDGER